MATDPLRLSLARLRPARRKPTRLRPAGLALEALEDRQLLSTTAYFYGVTAPDSNGVQDLVTFNSDNPGGSYKDLGAIKGLANVTAQALSRDPITGSYYLFSIATGGSGTGLISRLDTTTLQASNVAVANNGYAAGPDGFFAYNGHGYAYANSTIYDYDLTKGSFLTSTSISGTAPVASVAIPASTTTGLRAYGVTTSARTDTIDGITINSTSFNGGGFSTSAQLGIAGAQSDGTFYAVGYTGVDGATEQPNGYSLRHFNASPQMDGGASLPVTLQGFADRILTPTLRVTGFPANPVAGQSYSITVTADPGDGTTDASNNDTIQVTTSDGQALLPANAALVNGVGTFAVTLKTAGAQTITATDTSNASDTGTQSGITVVAADLDHYQVTGGVDATAGTTENFTVTALDAYGNTVTGNNQTLVVQVGDSQATTPGTVTTANGVGAFQVTYRTAGAQYAAVYEAGFPAHSGQQNFTITAGAWTKFGISVPATLTAGVAATVTATAQDAYGNTVTTANAPIYNSDTDASAAISANPFAMTNGVGTFQLTPAKAGTWTLYVATAGNAIINSVPLSVAAGALDHLGVVGGSYLAGVAGTVTVTAYDAYGNVATSVNDALTLTSSDPNATFAAGAALVNGVGTVSVTFAKAGPQQVVATDAAHATVSGISSGLTVAAGAATHLATSGAATATAGDVYNITVTAYDAYGNVATTYGNAVHLTSSDAQAGLPVDAALVDGVATFTVVLRTAGMQTVVAADKSDPTFVAKSGILVSAGQPTSYAVTGGTGAVAGVAQTFTVVPLDQFGNVNYAFVGTVNVATSDAAASPPAGVQVSDGVGTFQLALKTAGMQKVTVADSAQPTLIGLGSVTVAAAAADHFAVLGATGGAAGANFQYTIVARDAFGNTDTSYAGTIHFTSTDAQASLPADAALVGGVGTFDTTLRTAGSQAIAVNDVAAPAIAGGLSAIAVTPGQTATLVVAGPAAVLLGQPATFTASAFDEFGNLATGDGATLAVVASGTGVTAPASVTLVGGVATFQVTPTAAGAQTVAVNGESLTSNSASFTGLNLVAGTVYLDTNANGVLDAGEAPLAGRAVYLDLDGSGVFKAGDPTAVTDSAGRFEFSGYAAGSHAVREDTTKDASLRYVVNATATLADGSLTIGAIPYSPIAPIPTSGDFVGTSAAGGPANFVRSLYRTVLGRDGADAEVASWVAQIDAGVTPAQVALGFTTSRERRTDEVASYYENFLGRGLDPLASYWIDRLMDGATEASVVESILNSREYNLAHADSSTFARDLYLGVLGRQGGDAEVQAWVEALATGTSRAEVVASFVESDEANDRAVESLYNTALHRTQDFASGYWVTMLAQKKTAALVAASILSSDEYLQG